MCPEEGSMSTTREDAARIDVTARGASRFYWGWLIFSTTVSVLGNIAHALLVGPGGNHCDPGASDG
jgi:hypothetical protein